MIGTFALLLFIYSWRAYNIIKIHSQQIAYSVHVVLVYTSLLVQVRMYRVLTLTAVLIWPENDGNRTPFKTKRLRKPKRSQWNGWNQMTPVRFTVLAFNTSLGSAERLHGRDCHEAKHMVLPLFSCWIGYIQRGTGRARDSTQAKYNKYFEAKYNKYFELNFGKPSFRKLTMEMPIEVTLWTVLCNYVRVCCKFFSKFWKFSLAPL